MNKGMFLILSICLVLSLNIVSSQPPFLGVTTQNGLTVDALMFGTIKQNEDFTLHLHAYNYSTGLNLSNSSTKCAIHLYNSTGNHILRVDPLKYDGKGDWEAIISGGNFSKTGSYALEAWCYIDNQLGGSERLYFEVTPNGLELTTSKSIMYFLLLAGLATLFMYLLFNIKTSEYGWAIGYSFMAYLVAIIISFISYFVSLNYLYDIPIIASVLRIVWIVLIILFPVLLILTGFGLLKELGEELMVKRKMSYGYSRDEAEQKYKKK